MSEEIWRPVPSFPGYFASALGRIRGPRGIRKLFIPKDGYPQLNLWAGDKVVSRNAHVLICEAFHGPKPTPEHEVAHGDGIRANLQSDNLRWATRKENRHDMKAHGTWPRHESHPRASTTMAAVSEIRRRHAADASTPAGRVPRGWRQAIAAEFKITISAVKDIIGKRCWT